MDFSRFHRFNCRQNKSKNVFLPLGRVVDDAAYLEAVRKIKPQVLKQRLLNKCKRSFSERDFNGNK